VKRERQLSYIKPLNNPMGPKQTKCNITEQVQQQDYNSFCVALTTTTTPDVPSGSSFQVMTKYCMMWAGGSNTRILITCTIEWSKSSWIKGAIEKGANEGQISFAKDLLAELRKKLEGGSTGGKRKTNGKKKGGKRKRDENKDEKAPTEEKKDRGGVIGMCQQVAESAGDILGPLVKPWFSSTGLISFLLILVFYGLIRVERTMSKLSAAKLAAGTSDSLRSNGYADQEMLWDWIDSRIGKVSKDMRDGQVIWNNLANEGMTQDGLEEVEDAIQITEAKLKALKGAVGRKRSNTA
jgi:VAD1 Analog of StAR-related lipid transfer domain